MNFYKNPKKDDKTGKAFSVYMENNGSAHYVCDMIGSSAKEDIAVNELGLTLRARLTRSKGKFAMLEGTIFDPERLLKSACEITGYEKEVFSGGEYMAGYSLLTITADGCVNKYMVFSNTLLNTLINNLEAKIK